MGTERDPADRWRRAGVALLVIGSLLLVAVPITVGVFQQPPADVPVMWCGTYVLRLDPSDCPTCCESFGSFDTRGQIAARMLLAGLVALAFGELRHRRPPARN